MSRIPNSFHTKLCKIELLITFDKKNNIKMNFSPVSLSSQEEIRDFNILADIVIIQNGVVVLQHLINFHKKIMKAHECSFFCN